MALTKISSGLIGDDAISTASLADGIIQAAHLHSSHGITTSNIAEGSNEYHTTARARAAVSVSGSLAYNSSTGVISFTQRTDGTVRGLISVTDAGGDGSLAYNNSTGVITYTGPSAAEVRAHLSSGTGVTYSGGAFSIGQAVATTSDVTFGDLTVSGDLTVGGDTTTVNTATLDVEDLNITVGKAATSSSAANGAGLTFGAWSSGTTPTLTWDHGNTRFAMNKDLATNLVGNVTGNVTGNASGTAATVTTAAQPAITSLGTLTTLTVDDITINGSTISDGADLTLDVAGEIVLDADGGNVVFKDGGTSYVQIQNGSGSQSVFQGMASNQDMIFKVNDGGSYVDALTFDASEAGAATFNAGITATTGTFSAAGNGNDPILHVIDTADIRVAQFEGRRAADTGAFIDIRHNPSSPAESNRTGIRFQADDDAGNVTQYAKITQYISDNTNSTEDGDLAFNQIINGTDTEIMRLKAGNVGIGTSAPATEFHVRTRNSTSNYNAGGGFDLLENATAASRHATLFLDADNGNWSTSSDGAYFYIQKWGDGGRVDFIQQDAADYNFKTGGSHTRLHIDGSGGNIGIGTTGPTAKLHLYTSGAEGINLGIQNSERYYNIETDGGLLMFKDVSAGGIARMTFSTSGAVGIGRTASQSNTKLEVGGADNVPLIAAEASGVFAGLGTVSAVSGAGIYVGTAARFVVGSAGQIGVNGANYGTAGQAIVSGGSGSAATWGSAGVSTGKAIAMAIVFG